MKEGKLTPKQNAVIYLLQNGWILITDSSARGALVASKTHEFHIGNRLFWNLVDKKLIQQELSPPFEYALTPTGKKIKTKKVTL